MSTITLEQLTGYASALPTPFTGNANAIDEEAFEEFCDRQIEQGVSALIVNGTTGEAPTLSSFEQGRSIRLAADVADGRVPVIAGAGSNATAHAVELARQAESAGADGLLAVTPYYNRPSQEGLFRHFKAVHDATSLPILLYDVPSRTACSLAVDTVERLAELPGIIGLKDATGDLARPTRLRQRLGSRFRLMSGDDATAPAFIRAGGNGCISVLSNVAPLPCGGLFAALERGDKAEADAIARTLSPLLAALFAESNPVPLKHALSLMGRMRADLRLPLCAAAPETQTRVAEALTRLGLLSGASGQEVLAGQSPPGKHVPSRGARLVGRTQSGDDPVRANHASRLNPGRAADIRRPAR
jgi:4-hydroxy-tetrahydrodipicolinate synthase